MPNEKNEAKMRNEDERWMRLALELAKRGEGRVTPNPLVGAVIVKEGNLLGQGWHEYYGGLHAERNAIKDCIERGNSPEGSTIYVTLEPCCHYGKTPPCTEAIKENKFKRVVYGVLDPNPMVAGKGLKILSDAGIEVAGPVLEDECLKANEIFFHYMIEKTPYVILKYAMTADGKIGAYTGDSRWITEHEARQNVHNTRKRVAAIMVGINTVLSDNPMLNCRLDGDEGEYNFDPIRIICDSRLRLPTDSAIAESADKIRTIVAHLNPDDEETVRRAREIRNRGIELLQIDADAAGHVDMGKLIKTLGNLGIDSLLVEGGSELAWSAVSSGSIRKLQVYIGAKIIGGRDAKNPIGGHGFSKMIQAVELSAPVVSVLGKDILLEYDVIKES